MRVARRVLIVLAFDVMGDVGLGKEFHMMTSEKNRWIPVLLEEGMADVGITTPLPWMGQVLMKLPRAGKSGAAAWHEFVGSQVRERVEKQVERADVSFPVALILAKAC